MLTRLALGAAALLATGTGSARAADAESLLLPGIDLRSIDFVVGAWCRYRVIDEAMGESDSSEVTLSIVGRESTPDGVAYWIEIENGPTRGGSDARDGSRVLIDAAVKSMAAGDSLYHFVRRYYVKRGTGPVEPGDTGDLRRLTIAAPERDWSVTPDVRVSTIAGEFECERRAFDREETRDVVSGKTTIRQRRVDRVQVWVSPAVPIFHLARCEIERVRESKAVPAVRGVPATGPRHSRTVSELVAHGGGARSKLAPR